MRIIAITPARGGSKSIPRKNIKPFHGKPLLAWTADAAREAGIFDRIILSTDDEEIAEVGRQAGFEIPFLRPADLARDETPTLPVLEHALQSLREKEGYHPDIVVVLEPTSPGRRAFHIREAVSHLQQTDADSVVSVQEVPGHFSPHWQFSLADDGNMRLFTGAEIASIVPRRQELPKTYYRNGAIYAIKTRVLLAESPSLYGDIVRAYVMDAKYSLDIDTPDDWEYAERKMNNIITQ